jgi:hypothetical protein
MCFQVFVVCDGVWHFVAVQHEGVIPPVNIQCHYEAMKAAGVDVSYREVGGL